MRAKRLRLGNITMPFVSSTRIQDAVIGIRDAVTRIQGDVTRIRY